MKLETIQETIHAKMKEHKAFEVKVLRGIVAAIKKAAIDKKCEIDETLVNEILFKEQKMINEMIETCPKERVDLLNEYNERLNIVNQFVPQLITDETTIKTMIGVALASANIDPETANKGQIMKAVMPTLKGKVDMKIANQVIATFLK